MPHTVPTKPATAVTTKWDTQYDFSPDGAPRLA